MPTDAGLIKSDLVAELLEDVRADRPNVPSTWNGPHVGLRMVEAFEVFRAMTIRDYSTDARTAWPPGRQKAAGTWPSQRRTGFNLAPAKRPRLAKSRGVDRISAMKNPFRKPMTQKLQDTIAALSKQQAQLAARRAKVRDALDKATKSRQDALLGADEVGERELARLQGAVSDALNLLQGLDEAIGIANQRKAEAETQLAAECDRIERGEAADALDRKIAAIAAEFSPWLERSRSFVEALAEIGFFHFESGQIAEFLQNAMGQIEIAENFALMELKTWPAMVRDGAMPVPPPKPQPAPAVVAEPAPPTRTLFALRDLKWRDPETGRRQVGGQYEDVTLPIALADKAVRLGAAVPLTDDRRKTLRDARGGRHPSGDSLDTCDLDTAEDRPGPRYVPPANDPVLRQADFRVIDRSGEERVLSIAANRI